MGTYVLDFYCPEAKLCVELDGEFHLNREDLDRFRDEQLALIGIRTMRFASDSVFVDLGGILWKIKDACEQRVRASDAPE